jgi:hypothetical protein
LSRHRRKHQYEYLIFSPRRRWLDDQFLARFWQAGGSSRNIDGVYHGFGGGPITLTLKDGKATFQVANESKTLDYKVEDNKLTILDPKEGNVVFTINDDGTLNGELGVMTKKPL